MGRRYLKLLLPLPYETGADYLILEDDMNGDTGGAFVYYLSSTNPEEFFGDEWHESFEKAQKVVATEHKLSIGDWQVMRPEEINKFVLWYHGGSNESN